MLNEIPKDALAVGHDLAAELGIGDGEPWELRTGMSRVQAEELTVLVTGERPLDEVATALERSRDPRGRLVARTSDLGWPLLTVEGEVFQIGAVRPDVPTGAILEIAQTTRVTVRAPGATSGVDIVVLADCSGSMSTDDLTPPRESHAAVQATTVRRDDAVRTALERLLRLRLESSGRVSRIALVRFTDECKSLFPKDGGMRELDECSSSKVGDEFLAAITAVRAENAGTAIPEALAYAAQILRENDRGNEKLIVLLSDGAHYVKKDARATGEMLVGTEDPVSLMASLHRQLGVRLHAIGISTESLFDAWVNRQTPADRKRYEDPERRPLFCPNHDLLRRLMQVSGGHPAEIGDTDVLLRYFTGLGAGMARRVRLQAEAGAPGLQQVERDAIRAAAVPRDLPANAQARDRSRDALRRDYLECNRLALRHTGKELFPTVESAMEFLTALDANVSCEKQFGQMCNELVRSSIELAEKRSEHLVGKYGVDPAAYAFPDLVRLFQSEEVKDLKQLRNVGVHGYGNSDKSKMDRLKKIFGRLAGVGVIGSDDAPGWRKIQSAVLNEFDRLLREAARILTADPVELPPGPGRPQDPVKPAGVRVRD
jgi:hypothetical protein